MSRRTRSAALPLFDGLEADTVPVAVTVPAAVAPSNGPATHAGQLLSRRGCIVEVVWGSAAECRRRLAEIGAADQHWYGGRVIAREVKR